MIRACNALDAALRRGESGELKKQAVMTEFLHLVKASRGPATPAQVAAAFIIPTRNLLPEPHAGRVCLAEYLTRTTVEADEYSQTRKLSTFSRDCCSLAMAPGLLWCAY